MRFSLHSIPPPPCGEACCICMEEPTEDTPDELRGRYLPCRVPEGARRHVACFTCVQMAMEVSSKVPWILGDLVCPLCRAPVPATWLVDNAPVWQRRDVQWLMRLPPSALLHAVAVDFAFCATMIVLGAAVLIGLHMLWRKVDE